MPATRTFLLSLLAVGISALAVACVYKPQAGLPAVNLAGARVTFSSFAFLSLLVAFGLLIETVATWTRASALASSWSLCTLLLSTAAGLTLSTAVSTSMSGGELCSVIYASWAFVLFSGLAIFCIGKAKAMFQEEASTAKHQVSFKWLDRLLGM